MTYGSTCIENNCDGHGRNGDLIVHRVLKPGGMLFVGHAENFSESRDLFTLRGKTVYERR